MDKYDIEKHIMQDLQLPLEQIISKAINNVNLRGFNFVEAEDDIGIWKDDGYDLELNITSILTVSCEEKEKQIVAVDDEQKEIEDRFYRKAEKGSVKEINILSDFEGDLANGGFEQLYDNKGLNFLEEAISILETIGSTTKLKLAKDAYKIFRQNTKIIKKYDEYQRSLFKLDERYCRSEENIPLIYNEKFGV